MALRIFVPILIMINFLVSQEYSERYWNSLATHLTVGVPLAEDESLIGGRIQVKVNLADNNSYVDVGQKFKIDKGDIGDIKEISIPSDAFESLAGFKEGAKAKFIAQVWDRAGNNIIGTVSDSVLTIDKIMPQLISLEITTTNEYEKTMAMPGDSIVFQLNTNESIKSPIFNINDESYDGAVGVDRSWMLTYPADDADDGLINFEIIFYDLAGNPGEKIVKASNGIPIIKDGTVPELSEISLFTSNSFDSSMAIKGDSAFLTFRSSELIRDVKVSLNSSDANLLNKDSLFFKYYHVFTESDSEGVIPIMIDYKDNAGNLGESIDETTDDTEVIYDMTPPADFKVEMVGSLQGEFLKESDISDNESSNAKKNKQELGLISIIIISLFGLTILAVWLSWFIIFGKAGQAGWKALVPFFNLFIFTKIVNKPIWWLVIYLIYPIGYILRSLQIGKSFGKNLIFCLGLILLPIVFFPLLAFGNSQYIKPKN